MVSSTLFVDLTSSSTGSYEVTSLIKYLIELIGADVCAFRRNNQVSYRFVERARNVCDRINQLIAAVETDARWEDYFKYTAAVDILEE